MNNSDEADKLPETGRAFSSLFDKAGIAAALSSLPDGVLVEVNEAWVKVFGYAREEAIGRTSLQLGLNPDEALRARLLAELDASGCANDVEATLYTRTGEAHDFLLNLSLVEINGQQFILNTAQDITRQKRAEAELAGQNQKLSAILGSIQEDFYVLNRDWVFVYANRQFASRLGKEPEDFIGRNIWEMFPRHLGTVYEENVRAAMEKGEVRTFEIAGKYTDAWYRVKVFPSSEGLTLLGTDITERKQAEQQLRYQAALLSQVPDAIIASDAAFRVTAWNAGAEAMYGWQAEEALGRDGLEIVRTEWPGHDPEEIRQMIAQTGHWRGEAVQLRRDGTRFPVEVSSLVLRAEQGEILGYVSVNRDITGRKEAEAARQKAELRYKLVGDLIPFGVWEADPDGNATYLSPLFLEMVGQTLEENRKAWQTLIVAEEREPLVAAWQACVRAGSQWEREFTIRGRDGRHHTILARGLPVYDADGSLASYVGINFDVTERKQAEEQLRELSQRLTYHVDNSPLAVIEWGPDMRLIRWSGAAEQIFGWTAAEVLGKRNSDLNWVFEADRQQVDDVSGDLQTGQNPQRFSANRNYRKDGSVVYCEWYNSALLDESGQLRSILSLVLDVTARKQVEAALQVENERFLHFVDSNILGIVIGTAQGQIMLANEYYLKLLGVTREEFNAAQVDWKRFTPPEWLPADERSIQQLRQHGRSEPYEKEYVRPDGTRVPVYIANALLPGTGDEIAAFVIDITARKAAENALLQSEKQLQLLNETLEQKVFEKTAEVRRLAADLTKAEQRERHRISHILHDDLQQRIYALQMQLTLLRYELSRDNETARRELADLEGQLNELLQVTRHLSVDLSPPILRNEGLAHAISWLAAQMRERFGLVIELQAEGGFAIPDEALHVLLFNCVRELLFNVVKHARASRARVTLTWQGRDLCIEVQDDGQGLPLTGTGRLVSEKPLDASGLQTSFGLPTIRHQLSLFDGHLEIESPPALGTRITLRVPIAEA